MNAFVRWKYRLLFWFRDGPNAFGRRVTVENKLWAHYKHKTSPTPQECKEMAIILGVPR